MSFYEQAFVNKNNDNSSVDDREIKEFEILGVAGIIYAIIFVFCLYKNFMGVTNVVWAAATVGYMIYIAKKFEKNWRAINTFISIIIILLGISNFVTGNYTIILFNYIAIVCLMIANMMYLFFDVQKVNVTYHLLLLIQLALGVLIEFGTPFRQLNIYLKNHKLQKHSKVIYVLIGIIAAIPVFIIMLTILASADQVFKEVFRKLGEWLSIENLIANTFGIGVMFVIGYIVPYAFTKNVRSGKVILKEGKSGTNEPVIAIIVTGMVSLLYVLFCAIQIIYLFLGKGTLPVDYSYAEYAREGFFQLLLVSIFNVIVVIAGIEFFRESKILRVILTIISVCTFVMIASSAYRMGMYIGEYGLTFTRIFVLWVLLVITLIMAGLIYQLFRQKFNLFQYSLIIVAVCFTAFSLSHVDYFIAKYDLNMYEEMNGMHEDDLYGTHNYVDYDYLMYLSTDAAPAMKEHIDVIHKYMEENELELRDVEWSYHYYEEDGEKYNKITMRNFNISRYTARLIMKNY